LFARLVRKPKIIHCHGLDTQSLKRYYLNKILMTHLADLYISISRQMTEDLLELGINSNKIAYLPNGVDTNLFAPRGQKEDNLLLFVGRITHGKGLHVLVKSLRHLEKSVCLAIIGPASWDQKYYLDVLELMKKENQKGKHEIIYLGAKDQADIIKWYQKASLFVQPSFGEGFPVTTLEALSCETPAVATPVGGIPEVVKDYENGILIPRNDPVALARAIRYLLENKEVRTKFGREGRKRIIQHYSLEASVKRLCGIYKQLNS
jgi:glycosyltransferase involved in cell wall biosynthesis